MGGFLLLVGILIVCGIALYGLYFAAGYTTDFIEWLERDKPTYRDGGE